MSKFDVKIYPDSASKDYDAIGDEEQDHINIYSSFVDDPDLMFVPVWSGHRYPMSFSAEQVQELVTVLAYWLSTREEPFD